MIRDLFLLIRPWQWTKNLFVFLPLFFALKINNFNLLIRAGEAFICFCLLAGGVYIFNDYHDREDDRKHPDKKERPLAAGRVAVKVALTFAVLLVSAGLIVARILAPAMLYLAVFYIFLNIAYTVKLKHVSLLDIFTVSLGFVIRVFAGGVVTGVKIYPWIIVMTFLLALFLAMGKRRDDLLIFMNSGNRTRKSLDGYTLAFLDGGMVAMAAITIVSYIMYTMSFEIVSKFKADHLYLTTVFVILGIMRYLQITIVEQRSADPSEILLKDSCIQIAIVGWLTLFGLLVYL